MLEKRGPQRNNAQVPEGTTYSAGEAGIPAPEFIERVIEVKRVSKVVKGGKRLRIQATVVVGDGKGTIGIGHGKAAEVALAVRKATLRAKKSLTQVAIKDNTIPHETTGKFSASRILLKPASKGTGLVACPKVRAVLEAAGIRDCLTKSLGSNSSYNLAIATLNALNKLRSLEDIARARNKPISHFVAPSKVDRSNSSSKQEEKGESSVN
uniref:Small ribosomal subunit protein uS5 n=1 Tax=candidate division WOR-3 bacterium TaxID=2052148 RepID=A0A7C6EDZ7_UNCW3